MKKRLFILSLLFFSSCGLFEENHREVRYNLENGNQIALNIYEEKYPLSEKSLIVNVRKNYLKGKNCGDVELTNLGNEIWSEVVTQNNLQEINSGVLLFFSEQGQTTPYICKYFYSKKENGKWGKTDEWSTN